MEGVEFSIVLKDLMKLIITGYYNKLYICTFPQIQVQHINRGGWPGVANYRLVIILAKRTSTITIILCYYI